MLFFRYTLSAHNSIYPVENVVTNGFESASAMHLQSRHSTPLALVPLKFISERLVCILSILCPHGGGDGVPCHCLHAYQPQRFCPARPVRWYIHTVTPSQGCRAVLFYNPMANIKDAGLHEYIISIN